jgi:hypothetical protein
MKAHAFGVQAVFLALSFIVLSPALAQEKVTTPWNMKVKMVISDTCGISCPCLFGLEPHHGHCRFIGGVHIVDGMFGNVPLSGVNWAVFGEFTGSVKAGTQKWLYTAYYVDKRATQAQQKAMRAILSAPPFSTLGEQLGIKVEGVVVSVPKEELGTSTVSIGKMGGISATPAVGNEPGAAQKISNPVYPFPAKEIVLGTAEGKFSDHGKEVNFTRDSMGGAEISEFELSGGGGQR